MGSILWFDHRNIGSKRFGIRRILQFKHVYVPHVSQSFFFSNKKIKKTMCIMLIFMRTKLVQNDQYFKNVSHTENYGLLFLQSVLGQIKQLYGLFFHQVSKFCINDYLHILLLLQTIWILLQILYCY